MATNTHNVKSEDILATRSSNFGFNFKYIVPYRNESIESIVTAAGQPASTVGKGSLQFGEPEEPPAWLKERCTKLEYEDNETMDKMVLEFYNQDLVITEKAYSRPSQEDPNPAPSNIAKYFLHGTIILIRFGYPYLLSNTKYMKILYTEGYRTLKVHAYELASASHVKAGWSNVLGGPPNWTGDKRTSLSVIVNETVSHINRNIPDDFTDHRIEPHNVHVEELRTSGLDNTTPGQIIDIEATTSGMNTPLCFLQSLAEFYGYQCWIEDESVNRSMDVLVPPEYHLYIRPRDFLRPASRVYNFFLDAIDTQKAVLDYRGQSESDLSQLKYGGPVLTLGEPRRDNREKSLYNTAAEIDPFTGRILQTSLSYLQPDPNDPTKFIPTPLLEIFGLGAMDGTFFDLWALYQQDSKQEDEEKDPDKKAKINQLKAAIFLTRTISDQGRWPTKNEIDQLAVLGVNFTSVGFDPTLAGTTTGIDAAVRNKARDAKQKFETDLQKILSEKVTEQAKTDFERRQTMVTNDVIEMYNVLFGKAFREAQSINKMPITVIGDPTIKARDVIELRGTKSMDHRWYVLTVKHTIDTSTGYICSLDMISDATQFGFDPSSAKLYASIALPELSMKAAEGQATVDRNKAYNDKIEQLCKKVSKIKEKIDALNADSRNYDTEEGTINRELEAKDILSNIRLLLADVSGMIGLSDGQNVLFGILRVQERDLSRNNPLLANVSNPNGLLNSQIDRLLLCLADIKAWLNDSARVGDNPVDSTATGFRVPYFERFDRAFNESVKNRPINDTSNLGIYAKDTTYGGVVGLRTLSSLIGGTRGYVPICLGWEPDWDKFVEDTTKKITDKRDEIRNSKDKGDTKTAVKATAATKETKVDNAKVADDNKEVEQAEVRVNWRIFTKGSGGASNSAGLGVSYAVFQRKDNGSWKILGTGSARFGSKFFGKEVVKRGSTKSESETNVINATRAINSGTPITFAEIPGGPYILLGAASFNQVALVADLTTAPADLP